MMAKTDADSLLSALQQDIGNVKELLMTMKSGKCLPSCDVSLLARCKCVDCDP